MPFNTKEYYDGCGKYLGKLELNYSAGVYRQHEWQSVGAAYPYDRVSWLVLEVFG